LEKPLKPKIERLDSELKTFQSYIFKKAVRVKNIIYLAYKFPSVIILYGRSSTFKDESNNIHPNMCEIIHQNSEDMQLNSPAVSNYINPNAKLIMHVKCPSR
jgi:hypothetical protein